MIKLERIQKQYGSFLLDCSMEVHSGSITGLIGRNGSGKTTTFKAILGLIRTDSGTGCVLGKDPQKLSVKDREQMGIVLSDSGFCGELTVKDYLPVLDAWYGAFDRDQFITACRKFDLPLDKKIKEFSTGMKRKLHLLAALSHRARLLILDEPTAGLDVVARDEILDLLRGYMEEEEDRAILISSHISTDLEGLCDDLYMIDDGKIVLHEETDVLLADYGLLKVTKEQYAKLDKSGILRIRKEDYGYGCLTNRKRFYLENYPGITVENGSIDEVILMMTRGVRKEAVQ